MAAGDTYRMSESVGSRRKTIDSYDDIGKHYPSSCQEKGRGYAILNGRLEGLHQVGGETFVKKDIIFEAGGRANVLLRKLCWSKWGIGYWCSVWCSY